MKTEQIGFRTTPEIRRRLVALAREERRTLSWIINEILASQLVKTGKTNRSAP